MKNRTDNIIEIRNLKCKYEKNRYPILEIDELSIKRGDLVFFIGPSGVGKSTILETLGLMNNTMYKPDENATIFDFISVNNKEDIINLWSKNETEIAAFRRKRLSFIFQNTNLFGSISPLDNVSLAPILQGYSRKDAVNRTKGIIEGLFNEEEIKELKGKKIQELSGGQRQRIAFARAVASDYQILFADEPTGNLDVFNAKKLMSFLKKKLENEKNENLKTAVFVTHDIDLSIKYASKIVFINKKMRNGPKKDAYGYINNNSVFLNKGGDKWGNQGKFFSNVDLKIMIENLFKKSLENE